MFTADIFNEIKKSVEAAIDSRVSKESLIRFIDSLYDGNIVKADCTTMLNNIEPYRYFLDANNRWGIIVSLLHNSTEGVYVYYPDTMQFEVKDRFRDRAYYMYEPKQFRVVILRDIDKELIVVAFPRDRFEPVLLRVKPDRYSVVTISDFKDTNKHYTLNDFGGGSSLVIDVGSNIPKVNRGNTK